MQATYSKHRNFQYAVKVEGVLPNSVGSFEADRLCLKFSEKAKTDYIDAEGKSTLSAVKKWVKENNPSQFYAKWTADSSSYKDDVVQIFYLD